MVFGEKFIDVDQIFSSSFAEELGKVFTELANFNPNADKATMEYAGMDSKGNAGKPRLLTPRQLAQEITKQTPFGIEITNLYYHVSEKQGDPTGKWVISELSKPLKKSIR
jgi:hypothetical protein